MRKFRAKRGTFPCPAIKTNATFSSHYGDDDGFGSDDRARRAAYAKARAQGISPAGKVWSPQLNCWLDKATRMDDVKRICKSRGWGCDGSVNVKMREPEVDPAPSGPYQVADDLVEREVERIVEVEADGDITARERADLAESTRTRLSGNTSPGIDSLG